ncbi:MAG: pyruvate dehydrogenase complex dihydrolipoamide acetyltransferase [Phycisphaerae bacterium]|nr:pyruvate dehydrogenase complex dihydrolipoamide acetyltransferase [Phycisphaerae bacterium]
MPIEVTMPRLSDTMERGTVVAWHKKEGDAVSSGEVIADIETDKATMELEAFDDGVVAKLAVGEGEEAAVGSVIMVIAEEGEDPAEAAKSVGASSGSSGGQKSKAASEGSGGDEEESDGGGSTAVAEKEEKSSASGTSNGSASGGDGGRVFASPLARKLAEEKGVDLSGLSGSGPRGRIVKADVEAASSGGGARSNGAAKQSGQSGGKAAPAPAPLPAPGAALEDETVPLNNMRGTIARRLVESKQTIPHYQVTVSARLDALMTLRGQLNEQLESQGVKLSVNDFLVRACALAMHQHPYVNSSWVEKGPAIKKHGRVNVGVAVALPEERGGGLVVATIRDADRQGLRHISAETKRLAKKARDKGLSVEDMSDSTFTISNLGMFGVDHFTAIVNPPNAAILAVGRAIEKVFVVRDDDGEPAFEVGHEMAMTMSSDHRIVDGAMAAQYLSTVKELLENPAALLV